MSLSPHLDSLEASLLAAVSTDELMALTARIASEVRLSGSPEERRALAFIEEQLAAVGFRTRLIEHDGYISLPGAAQLEVEGLGAFDCITHSFATSTPPAGLVGEIVDVGTGAESDWARPDVRGYIALIDGLATPEQARRANAAGAVGQIFINDDHLHEMILSPVWGNPTPERLAHYPRTPAGSVRASDGARIRAALPQRAHMHTTVETGWRALPILEAHLPGAIETDKYVMFAGHIDSWHYGAMDNGSANAVMTHLGRLLAQHAPNLRRGLRLCFWSGHSHGRYAGSAWYADNHWDDLRRNCVAYVNIDSVGGQGATLLTQAFCVPETFDLEQVVIRRYAEEEFEGSRVGRAGDESFMGIGIPALLMTVSEQPPTPNAVGAAALWGGKSGGLGWWWHTPDDTLDKLNPAFLARDARLYAATLFRLCAEPILPFNYAAAAAELDKFVADYQSMVAGRFDLTPARTRTQNLCRIADELQTALEQRRNRGAFEPQALADVNVSLMALGRATLPLNYTRAGPFDHDPALSVPPLPLLADARRLGASAPDSDESKFAAVSLRRGLNQLVYGLDEALAAMKHAHAAVEHL